MLLIGSGQKFIQDLEKSGALGVHVSPVGGSEGPYQRRLKKAGYTVIPLSAKGIGDVMSYLTRIHGVRPAHLGHASLVNTAAVGEVHYWPPLIDQYRASMPANGKGLVFWFYEGNVLSQQELNTLVALSQEDKRVKFVVEVARDRYIHWNPLKDSAA